MSRDGRKEIFIAFPCYDPIDPRALECLFNLVARAATNPQYKILYCADRIPNIAIARNVFVERALSAGADYLLFIDPDQMYPADALDRLIAHDKDIVSALYFRRDVPTIPCMYRAKRENGNVVAYEEITNYPKGLIEVEGIGMGMALIKTGVFRKIPKPWFWLGYPELAEDLYFCWKAEPAGFRIYVDTNLVIGHIYNPPLVMEETYRENTLRWEGTYSGEKERGEIQD